MKGYIIGKALGYLRKQLPDLRAFWELAIANGWVDIGLNGDTADCALSSVEYVLRHGTPNAAAVRKALGK